MTPFGINAHSARHKGDGVIEAHDELGTGSGGHEEAYLVVRGAARFTIDGDVAEALEHHPDNERVHYELACQVAMSGDLDSAREHLRRAIRLNPGNADYAREDDDLAAVLDVLDEPSP